MAGRNRNDFNDAQNYNRSDRKDAGYESRYGNAGMKGPHRYAEFETDSYSSRGGQDFNEPSRRSSEEYSTFEGTNNRPYYGGEEGRFPYGGSGGTSADRSYGQRFYSNEDRNFSNRTSHAGKGPKGYRRSDEKIKEDVCEQLTAHRDIDATEIEVDVKDGMVQLTGTVESRNIKRLAEDIADHVSGVRDVQNSLRILAHEDSPEAAREFSQGKEKGGEMSEDETQSSSSLPRRTNSKFKSSKSRSKGSSSRHMSQ